MGCINSTARTAPVTTDVMSVDQMLLDAREAEKRRFKVLLLGAGESGKSTVVKQIKNIHNLAEKGPALRQFVVALQKNVIEAIQTLISACKTLKIPIESPEAAEAAETLISLDAEAIATPELAPLVDKVWKDPGIQAVFARRHEYWNMDATPYYLDEVFRISATDFEPTEEDQLMARVRTTGIVISEIHEEPFQFDVVDVGGQRSERRKWIHCFDDVKAIIFLASLSGYNQVLFEDSTENIMHESLKLFEEIVSNPIFRDTQIFLFLNKKDLFEKTIHQHSLKKCFPDYDGPDGAMAPALEFIQQKFAEVVQRAVPGKNVPQYVIAARVKREMKDAFSEIKDSLKRLYSKDTTGMFAAANSIFTRTK